MRKKKILKFLLFFVLWAVILVSVLSICNSYMLKNEKYAVPYTTFLEEVNNNNIKKIEINKNASKIYFKYSNDKFLKHHTTYPNTDEFIEDMLLQNIDVSVSNGANANVYLTIFELMFFIVFSAIFFKRMDSSDTDTFDVSNNNITFKDVAGMNELKAELLLYSDMMKNSEYKDRGVKLPKGILLEGPPGNGKTLIAKAFAGEAGVNFLAINACDLGSKFIGVGSMKIKKLFKKAQELSPCVLFIDEIDAVGEKRTNSGDAAGKEMNTVLTSLLNQMDGFEQNEGVLVLAATNRADALDAALLRPGRFDRKIIVNTPDRLTRRALFEFALKNIDVSENISIELLANKTKGCSCAEITTIVNDAIIKSIQNKHSVVEMSDFEDAILTMEIKGHVREEYEQTPREKQIIAYHEAGHAIISHFYCNKRVSLITTRPTTSGAGGFTITETAPEELMPISDIKKRIVMCYGGRAAETFLKGNEQDVSAGASQDVVEATKLALKYILIQDAIDYTQLGENGEKRLSDSAEKLLQECSKIASKEISRYKEFLVDVAENLIQNESLTESEFLKILDSRNKF